MAHNCHLCDKPYNYLTGCDCQSKPPTVEQRLKRGEEAEKLLERVWRTLQTNQLTHYTDDVRSQNYDDRCERDRTEFRNLYSDILDFDPGCVDWW